LTSYKSRKIKNIATKQNHQHSPKNKKTSVAKNRKKYKTPKFIFIEVVLCYAEAVLKSGS
jgi:hypothetical protein